MYFLMCLAHPYLLSMLRLQSVMVVEAVKWMVVPGYLVNRLTEATFVPKRVRVGLKK